MKWHDWERYPHNCPIKAFCYEGSLTKYIEQKFGPNKLNLRNIIQEETEEFIIRKVDEYLDNELIIKASLIFYKNKSSTELVDMVRNLGDKPIGHILFNDHEIQRNMNSWDYQNGIYFRKTTLKSPRFYVELIEGFVNSNIDL